VGITREDGPYQRINYWPDNDENTLYIADNENSLDELISIAKMYFGDRYDPSKILISFQNIHTKCITYDLYDPDDWTDFTIISLTT
jgi:hypothetical protein